MTVLRALLLCGLAVVVVNAVPAALEGCNSVSLHVTMRVFSGTTDPNWELTSERSRKLFTMISSVAKTARSNRAPDPFGWTGSSRVMGYKGFVVSCAGSKRGVLIANQPEIERFLLATAPRETVSVAVRTHVLERLAGAPAKLYANAEAGDLTQLRAKGQCAVPIVGPNTPPVYNPDTDDQGCFETDQSDNNCYNYGTDIVTDTFAQPGRGSGQKWQSNTCEDMSRAAKADGAIPYGTTLPVNQPTKGHYVALFIWPDTNFHWIRRDSAQYWSHKPGGTPVRNTDNNGNNITDPTQSDFSPWTQFCSFWIIIPSNMTIN